MRAKWGNLVFFFWHLFSHLVDKNAPPEVRDQIWFNIGKLRYQKGLQDDAIRALEQIQGALDSRTMSESNLLLANMLMNRGEYEDETAAVAWYSVL